MRSISQKYLWACIPVFFLLLLVFRFILKESILTNISIVFIAASIGIYLLLCNKDLFFSLCLFFIPISVSVSSVGGVSIVAPSELMILILSVFVIVWAIIKPAFYRKILLHPITIILLLDISWMTIVSFYSEMPVYSFKRILARGTFLFTFYLFAAQWMTKKENLVKFFFLYSLGLMVPILVTEYHHALFNFNPKTVYELCLPFYNEHTIYGACIAYVLPFILIIGVKAETFGFSKSFKRFVWVLFFVLLAAEILAFSRAAWLSLGAAFLMFIFLKLKLKFLHFMVILATIITLFIVFLEPIYTLARENDNLSNKGEIGEHILSVGNLNSDASNLERINRWSCAYKMFQDRPLTGYGPGTYQFVYGPYQSVYEMTYISTTGGDRGNAHSEPLTYLSETGLPGFILYMTWMLASIAFGIRAYYRARNAIIKNMILAALLGFITFFFHGFVNSFIDQLKLASLVFGSMAMIVVTDIANTYKPVHQKQ